MSAVVDGFELPAEVRRIRAWWLREAARHLQSVRAGAPYREWHLAMARDARQYAREVRARALAAKGTQ